MTYQKVTPSGTDSCQFSLFVGARGLRVELDWDHPDGFGDLDLHAHRPGNAQPWALGGGLLDCGWANCTVGKLQTPSANAPAWFPINGIPPAPVAWWLDPVNALNICHSIPITGSEWVANGMGCHNPRLETETITCDPTVLDPADLDFCRPEIIAIDFPPTGVWMRVGVHYFAAQGRTTNIAPRIQVFCDGGAYSDLGPDGYGVPRASVLFPPARAGALFWMVADVRFTPGGAATQRCSVHPLYADLTLKTPLLTTDVSAGQSFGPPYPP